MRSISSEFRSFFLFYALFVYAASLKLRESTVINNVFVVLKHFLVNFTIFSIMFYVHHGNKALRHASRRKFSS